MTAGKLDLIIFHYHLLPGGVTDVIKHSLGPLAAARGIGGIKIVCGRKDNTEKMNAAIQKLREKGLTETIELIVMPEIDYLSSGEKEGHPEKLENLLLERFSSPDSIWLVHNYHLGKNWAFTAALNSIAMEESQKIIYQIHDFPECARFANLNILKSRIEGSLYPRSGTLRYCVINMRDYHILKDAGIPEETLFLLENPLPLENNPSLEQADRPRLMKRLKDLSPKDSVFHPEGALWLYPVRSIRRKNVLEGGVITALTDDPVNLILTLPGISPQEKSYSGLCEKAYAEGLIPGLWGTGALPESSGIGYTDLISASDMIFSSSVQEGFGYMYLNALLWKKPLLARYLDIMEGFLPVMENYPAHLYPEVRIPADKSLAERLKNEYLQRIDDLESLIPEGIKKSLTGDLQNIFSKDSLEFSYLSPEMQFEFLVKMKSDTLKSECRELNRNLADEIRKLNAMPPSDRESQLRDGYGEKAYTEAFTSILDSFGTARPPYESQSSFVDDRLLQRFSRAEFFRLLYL